MRALNSAFSSAIRARGPAAPWLMLFFRLDPRLLLVRGRLEDLDVAVELAAIGLWHARRLRLLRRALVDLLVVAGTAAVDRRRRLLLLLLLLLLGRGRRGGLRRLGRVASGGRVRRGRDRLRDRFGARRDLGRRHRDDRDGVGVGRRRGRARSTRGGGGGGGLTKSARGSNALAGLDGRGRCARAGGYGERSPASDRGRGHSASDTHPRFQHLIASPFNRPMNEEKNVPLKAFDDPPSKRRHAALPRRHTRRERTTRRSMRATHIASTIARACGRLPRRRLLAPRVASSPPSSSSSSSPPPRDSRAGASARPRR
eukprot:23850-Pelagococcus_subviridis.AAC.1